MAWYNDVAAEVQKRITELNWPPLLLDRPWEVTSRAKTIDTLRDKLRRDPGTPLPSVQDFAGVRFEAEMSLDEQDAVVTAICGLFGHDEETCVKDLREKPHSGYRAVHIWLRLPVRVEVQVRTHLQGEWANTYEYAADLMGREIRYDRLPENPVELNVVQGLHDLSTQRIATIEADRNEIASLELSIEEAERGSVVAIPDEVRARIARLKERGLKNEKKLREDLAFLQELFQDARKGRE
ncbi:Region found in RelA / SpoT proteins [Streptococcus pyogenes]|nr:Region found in RelA / SpoT proteins [Streptococcus pyogenes]